MQRYTQTELSDLSQIFHYVARAQCVIDITDGNRTSLRNARDPGGRIGGYNESTSLLSIDI